MVRNEKGYSLLELVMSGGISIVLMLFAVRYFQKNNADSEAVKERLEDTLDGLNFEHRMRRDLFETKYSFNTINQPDDKNKNFFDYIVNGNCSQNCDREIILEKPKKENTYSKAIYFIIKDTSSDVEQIFHPMNAYRHVGARSHNNSSISFVSLNHGNTLANLKYTPWRILPNQSSRLLLLYSPYYLYANHADRGIAPGRMLQFLGWLNRDNFNGKLVPERIDVENSSMFNNRDIRDGSTVTDEDTLFKKIPYIAGNGVYTMIAPVKVVRFRVKNSVVQGKAHGQLVREELFPGKQYQEVVYAADVKRIAFRRSDIANANIDIKIDFENGN